MGNFTVPVIPYSNDRRRKIYFFICKKKNQTDLQTNFPEIAKMILKEYSLRARFMKIGYIPVFLSRSLIL